MKTRTQAATPSRTELPEAKAERSTGCCKTEKAEAGCCCGSQCGCGSSCPCPPACC